MTIKGFKNGAYIYLNTPEIREKLEKLGYARETEPFGVKDGSCILTYPCYREDCPDEIHPHYIEVSERYFVGAYNWCANRINCGTDIDKFFEVVSEKYDD